VRGIVQSPRRVREPAVRDVPARESSRRRAATTGGGGLRRAPAGVPAKIFVPTVSAPAKIERIRQLGADLVVAGDRYADALAAAQQWEMDSGR